MNIINDCVGLKKKMGRVEIIGLFVLENQQFYISTNLENELIFPNENF
jgi:hypothetical protein